jgi:hypothetical protein
MKELGKKENVLKKVCTLLFATVLICSSLVTLTNTALSVSDTPVRAPTSSPSWVEILSENFTDGNMPPTDWELKQTNPNETWHIDNSIPQYPVSKPSATVHRGSSTNTALQDEWLITPSLDVSKYKYVYLNFYSYSCYFVTAFKRYVELNVSVSTDGGGNWTNAWSFDDVYEYPHHFNDWTWYLQSINLSSYTLGENDVKIAIQYYCNCTTEWEEQMFSIDDIFVLGNGTVGFGCDAGGPYDWYWDKQNDYPPYFRGVQFHGIFWNASAPVQWLWDFGDGNTSTLPQYTWHFYNDVGIFNVTLTVTDNKTSPPRVAFSKTTVKLFLFPPPPLDIKLKKIALGLVADIINNGSYNATYVNWTMNMSWGLPKIFKEKTIGNGTCDNIVSTTSQTIRSKYYSFGFGRIHVTIRANPENLPLVEKGFYGWKIGPLVFVLR